MRYWFFLFLIFTLPAYAETVPQSTKLPSWTYDGGKDNQDNWAYLSPAYTVCETGVSQSPINISDTVEEKLPKLDFDYTQTTGHVRRVDLAIRIDVDGKEILREGKKEYRLQYIIFHSPSEHTVRGQFYTMEAEMYHTDKAGHLLVLSTFIGQGGYNDVIESMVKQIGPTAPPEIDIQFNPIDLLPPPGTRGYYAYTGSLTTPPCTEGVQWRIFKNPIGASAEEIEQIVRPLGRDARLVQPVYMRAVKESIE